MMPVSFLALFFFVLCTLLMPVSFLALFFFVLCTLLMPVSFLAKNKARKKTGIIGYKRQRKTKQEKKRTS
jgi:multisubunit Na+/H+ antiporter MnhG subunit